jgi:membrane-associated phospholipid phosphatase
MHFRSKRLVVILAAAAALTAGTARADSNSNKALKAVSGPGTVIYLAAAIGLPLAEDKNKGADHAIRTVDALIVSVGIAEITQPIVREQRPNKDDHSSFPSEHATAAFAAATMQSDFHPGQAPYWYLGATAIAAARVGLHEHFIHDVVAGALLGYGTAKLELGQRHGLILTPIIGRGADKGINLQVAAGF